jgi:hypothetical protein
MRNVIETRLGAVHQTRVHHRSVNLVDYQAAIAVEGNVVQALQRLSYDLLLGIDVVPEVF